MGGRGKVWFAHLDLGIGGAEQLVVNAALALQEEGFDVTLFTTHHDPNHCFAPTRGDGPLADRIKCVGDWLPRHIFGKAVALCSYIRMVYLALVMVTQLSAPDAVFCDGVSLQIPILAIRSPVSSLYELWYNPDPGSERGSVLKRIYRAVLDPLEEWTTLLADRVCVNSHFTAQVFMNNFTHAKQRPEVLYPVADFGRFTQPDWAKKPGKDFLSLNRFERKKNVGLALRAFAKMKRRKNKLVIAGGYDERVTENVEYLKELQSLAKDLRIEEDVSFQPSVSDQKRDELMQTALAVLYTPENEHFGIVPIEAMFAGNPVLAPASGGPLETIREGETGYLLPSDPERFAVKMQELHDNPALAETLGKQAHSHVCEKFGSDAFRQQLSQAIQGTIRSPRSGFRMFVGILLALLVIVLAYGLNKVLFVASRKGH